MISHRKLHRWIAICAVLPGLLILLSGAGLSFAKELDRFMQPALLSVAATGEIELSRVHAIVTSQLQAQPQWALAQVRYPRTPYDPVTLSIFVKDQNHNEPMLVYLNPHTGKLLGQRLQARELAEKLRRLHVELFSPPIGKSLAALIGVALLLMIGVGVSLVRAQGQWRCNSWHARLGLLIAPVLVSIVASGLYSAYGPTDGAGISHRHALVTQSNSISLNSLNEMTNQLPIACAELPVSITASAKGLRLRCPDRLDFNLYPSAESETPVAVGDGGRLLWNLHSGEWAGLPGRGIWMWSVLAVLYLLYSGIRDWRHRKVKR